MKMCRHIEKLKEFHSEYQCTYHLDSVINDLVCFLYHLSFIYLSFCPSINPYYYF